MPPPSVICLHPDDNVVIARVILPLGSSSHFDVTRSSCFRWHLFRETLTVQAAADG
jgi:hypothetical protein